MKHIPNHHRIATTGGYTLMEMILVLGIMALLLSAGVYYMVGVIGSGEEAKVKADVQAISASLIRYQTKARSLPTQEQGLKSLAERPTTPPQPEAWQQFMKKKALVDPWAREYQYRNPGTKNPESFDVYSLGKDGKEGTEDDIGNW
ncbi:MAG: type II secretion system major pseudopilin GspG [Verrucomicrobiales bacterium]|nr:type II secretion system major pseudopilin GspG [Verrucomicrobiales bacterium]